MNTAIIMLGSNQNPKKNLELAIEKLSEVFDLVAFSQVIISKAIGKNYKADFHNQAVKLLSADNAEETRFSFKLTESELGRTPESKKSGLIPIDIDLIFWNNTKVHPDYDRFDFVRNCVNEIL
jgi:2-amino-4-hydroxy-6-hydroxymethyldihydropteridine diphosphokinase